MAAKSRQLFELCPDARNFSPATPVHVGLGSWERPSITTCLDSYRSRLRRSAILDSQTPRNSTTKVQGSPEPLLFQCQPRYNESRSDLEFAQTICSDVTDQDRCSHSYIKASSTPGLGQLDLITNDDEESLEPFQKWTLSLLLRENSRPGFPQKSQRRLDAMTRSYPGSKCALRPGQSKLSEYEPRYPELLLQPYPRPIAAQKQLAAEVKRIYAGLVMIEKKCIRINQAVNSEGDETLATKHWEALTRLHRSLLHEHHDLTVASQHPSASPSSRLAAIRSAISAQVWSHLKQLQKQLPQGPVDILASIYSAYQMTALLQKTKASSRVTWKEHLSDLRRYEMAIEHQNIAIALNSLDPFRIAIESYNLRDIDARFQHRRPADAIPSVGRLYHHLTHHRLQSSPKNGLDALQRLSSLATELIGNKTA